MRFLHVAAVGIFAFADPAPASVRSYQEPPQSALTSSEKVGLETAKITAEIDKLHEEVRRLRSENEALSSDTRRVVSILSAASGLAGAAIGAAATLAIFLLQRGRQKQDAGFERNRHNFELFKGLADASPRVRIASAAVLLNRVDPSNGVDGDESLIVKTLLTALKDDADGEDGVRLRKYIADNLPAALGAKASQADGRERSPLANYDCQELQAERALLKGIDGRGVDFFHSRFSNASFSGADLRDAVLMGCDCTKAVFKGARMKRANLAEAVLRGANLDGADLEEANLRGADLSGSSLEGAKLDRAVVDPTTVWPIGFVQP